MAGGKLNRRALSLLASRDAVLCPRTKELGAISFSARSLA